MYELTEWKRHVNAKMEGTAPQGTQVLLAADSQAVKQN